VAAINIWQRSTRKIAAAARASCLETRFSYALRPGLRLLSQIAEVYWPSAGGEAEKPTPDSAHQAWREEDYLRIYPDVRRAVARGEVQSGLSHWLASGQAEGRLNPATDNLPVHSEWDEQGYFYLYPDVEQAVERGDFASGYAHYVIVGRKELRRLPHAYGPTWLVNEMKEISEIESALHPSPKLFAISSDHRPQTRRPLGQTIHTAFKYVAREKYTHVVLLPWLRRGGADLGALHHVNALALQPKNKILVITTEDAVSSWLDRLPTGTDHLDLGLLMRDLLSQEDRIYVLTRLLLALEADTIHIINSNLAWKTITAYGEAICAGSRIFASIYCFDYDVDGKIAGYTSDLENAWEKLEKVFTDNVSIVNSLMRTHAYPKDLFHVLPFPTDTQEQFKEPKHDIGGRQKILWAGRFDRQKRPDLLRDIALRMPDVDFIVYGSPMLDTVTGKGIFKSLGAVKNLYLCGPFDGFADIPRDEIALFLYTSAWDGMPNIILEAFSSGLPVIASKVGGISEAYPEGSPFLVSRSDDVDAYVESLRKVLRSPTLLDAERARVLKHCRDQRSFERFVRRLSTVEGYSDSEYRPVRRQCTSTSERPAQGAC
jgi:glycosyltransferase involved in cell wall biosynthesis